MITTVRIGELFPDAPHVGHHLPVGSVLTQSPSMRLADGWTQQAPRTWVCGRTLIDPYHLISPMYLRKVGDDTHEVTLPLESAAEYRWRLRDTALAAAERSSVNQDPVLGLVESFGAIAPRFTVGGVVSNELDIQALPPNSVVYSGHPDAPDYMNVWEMTERGLHHVFGLGRHRNPGQSVTIYSLPDGVAGADEPAADATVLGAIAVRAFRLGKACQTKHSWCSVFDNTLMALGITDKLLHSLGTSLRGPGEEIDRASAAYLPEGSLLWWSWHNRQAFAVYVRDDKARNTSKTKRLFGFDDDQENSHERMVILQVPEEEMIWRLNGWMLAKLPNGVKFRLLVGGAETVLDDEHRNGLTSYAHYQVTEWAA